VVNSVNSDVRVRLAEREARIASGDGCKCQWHVLTALHFLA
jgi:hypothetical protein